MVARERDALVELAGLSNVGAGVMAACAAADRHRAAPRLDLPDRLVELGQCSGSRRQLERAAGDVDVRRRARDVRQAPIGRRGRRRPRRAADGRFPRPAPGGRTRRWSGACSRPSRPGRRSRPQAVSRSGDTARRLIPPKTPSRNPGRTSPLARSIAVSLPCGRTRMSYALGPVEATFMVGDDFRGVGRAGEHGECGCRHRDRRQDRHRARRVAPDLRADQPAGAGRERRRISPAAR